MRTTAVSTAAMTITAANTNRGHLRAFRLEHSAPLGGFYNKIVILSSAGGPLKSSFFRQKKDKKKEKKMQLGLDFYRFF